MWNKSRSSDPDDFQYIIMPISQNSQNLLPSESLTNVANKKTAEKEALNNQLATLQVREQRLSRQVTYESVYDGRQTVELKERLAVDRALANQAKGAQSTASLAGTLSEGNPTAAESFVYDPTSLAPGTSADPNAIEVLEVEVASEVGDSDSDSSKVLDTALGLVGVAMALVQTDLKVVNQDLESINDTLAKRASGELPEPELQTQNLEMAVTNIFDDLSQGLTEDEKAALKNGLEDALAQSAEAFSEFVENAFVVPYTDNKRRLEAVRAQIQKKIPTVEDAPIFDLVYGPPQSTKDRFVLSEDGLYYDSRNGGIPLIWTKTVNDSFWQHRFASNKGGKGVSYSDSEHDAFADTIFSDDFKETNGRVEDFIRFDDVLKSLVTDRNLEIMDVSATIVDLMTSGYDASSAMVKNYKESYGAVDKAYSDKIRVRKKQLQLAALFGPFGVTGKGHSMGPGHFYEIETNTDISNLVEPLCGTDKAGNLYFSGDSPSTGGGPVVSGPGNIPLNPPGSASEAQVLTYLDRIPINDFSYLKKSALIPSIDVQKRFTLMSSDLDDVIKPMSPKYLTAVKKGVNIIPALAISEMADNGWINSSGDNSFSGVLPHVRNLDDDIVTEKLLIHYAFLDPLAATYPGSDDYLVRNHASTSPALNGKLVGDPSGMFVSGISIPYLNGTVLDAGLKYGGNYNQASGSYVRLPSNIRSNSLYPPSNSLDNLMYSTDGWSFDFWVHTPELHPSLTFDHRYKLIVSNENCGDEGTRGLMVGFRDRGRPQTNSSSGLEFVILRTEGAGDADWSQSVIISSEVSGAGSASSCVTEKGFVIPLGVTTDSGKDIGQSDSEFAHYNVSYDVLGDTIAVYLDGEFLSSGVASTSFGTNPGTSLNVPSRITNTSHNDEYGRFGESLYSRASFPSFPVFTPWILGGGFTDGIFEASSVVKTPPGFLGSNTDKSFYIEGEVGPKGAVLGQHTNSGEPPVPGLGGYTKSAPSNKFARSGLEGFLGSFKVYTKPLDNKEVLLNYDAQKAYFKNILTNTPRTL